MQELLNLLVLLAIISCGLSIMLFPFTGRVMDPFIILRPLVRGLRRGFGNLFAAASKALKNLGRAAWRRAGRRRTLAIERVLLYIVAFVLALIAGMLSIPASLLGKR